MGRQPTGAGASFATGPGPCQKLRVGHEHTPSARLRIVERFRSLQGEGLRVGTPSAFVRTTGCNLRCRWCDTPASSWAPEGAWVTVEELVTWCADGPRDVVLTGGEPLLQPAIVPLSQALAAAGHVVTVETAGTVWRDDLACDLASLSPKLAHARPPAPRRGLATRHEAARWRPDVLARFMATFPWQLKLVVRAGDPTTLAQDVAEVEDMVRALAVAPADRARVVLMPEGTDAAALRASARALSPVCIERGFTLGQRLHIELYGHRPGT